MFTPMSNSSYSTNSIFFTYVTECEDAFYIVKSSFFCCHFHIISQPVDIINKQTFGHRVNILRYLVEHIIEGIPFTAPF